MSYFLSFVLLQMLNMTKEKAPLLKAKRTASFLSSSPYLTSFRKVESSEKAQLESALAHMGSWDFDVNDLVAVSKNQVLLVTGMELFKRWGLDSKLEIKDTLIANFFSELEQGYVASNPYHNS